MVLFSNFPLQEHIYNNTGNTTPETYKIGSKIVED
jgi:hypothetical protein